MPCCRVIFFMKSLYLTVFIGKINNSTTIIETIYGYTIHNK